MNSISAGPNPCISRIVVLELGAASGGETLDTSSAVQGSCCQQHRAAGAPGSLRQEGTRCSAESRVLGKNAAGKLGEAEVSPPAFPGSINICAYVFVCVADVCGLVNGGGEGW